MFNLRIHHAVLIPIVFLVIIGGCQKDNMKSRDYPRLSETKVANVTDSGAFFSANLYSLGSVKILSSGFVWDRSESFLSIDKCNKIVLPAPTSTGVFSCEVKSAMVENQDYYVRSFVQTDQNIVYGPSVKFYSLGSKAPVITGFEPHSASWMDSILIRGRNFAFKSYDIVLKLGDETCPITVSTDTTIKARVSAGVGKIKNILSVEVAGNTTIYNKDTFNLKPPILNDYSPKTGFWGDTILITGKDFQYLNYINHSGKDSVKLGTANCIRFGNIDAVIRIKVPFELYAQSSQLRISIGGFVLNSPDYFVLKSPQFTFSPLNGTWNSIVTLTGRFNTIGSGNKVYFNNTEANIVSVTDKQMVVTVPSTFPESSAVIRYIVAPFNVISSDTFRIDSPVIKSFSPASGPKGTTITIRGKNYNPTATTVYFGDVLATNLSVNDSTVFADVPLIANGPVKISVKVFSQTVTSLADFSITNPVVNIISPLSGTFDDEITINGENFIPPSGTTTVSFDGIQATIVSITSSKIVVKVPLECDSIPRAISVIAGSNSIISADKFTLNPPEITAVSPATYTAGQDVIISGHNFNPAASKNEVLWDIFLLEIKSATESQIVATWPLSLPRGTMGIGVKTGGYIRASSDLVTVSSPWLRIPAPSILTSYPSGYYMSIRNFGESMGGKGYIISGAMNGTYQFDPDDKSWIKVTTFPIWYQSEPYERAASLVINDTLYLIGKYIYGMTRNVNNWRFLVGGDTASLWDNVVFYLNNKIYAGLSCYFGIGSFFEFDPANNYSRVRKGDFPVQIPGQYSGYFTLGNRGYLVLGNNQVWEFNPDNAQWTRKNDFPGQSRVYATSFVLGGYAYFGTGTSWSSSTEFQDLWKYDPGNDSWSFAVYVPIQRFAAAAFTIGSRAYFGFGISLTYLKPGEKTDFYEFDPTYLSK
jgi:hypothetical protein